jgi:hypothetical protein
MVGATAATAAGFTASPASANTIQLHNNYISGAGGNHLNADLTGDGKADIAITGAQFFRIRTNYFPNDYNSLARVFLNSTYAVARHNGYPLNYVRLGCCTTYSAGPKSITGLIAIFFSDKHINNGKLTEGWLEVTAFAPGATVNLDSLTFSNVPDNGSSLALLAMGAGGVLALRRLRAAQGQS